MENTEIITKNDLQNLGISKYVREMLLEGVNIENMAYEDLFSLVNNLINLISQVMYKQQENNKGYSYSFKNIRKTNFQQIILIGGLLVFRIRQFLLQDSIFYSLGAQDERGILYQRKMSQDELWSSTTNRNRFGLRSSLSQKAIVLSKSLENLKLNFNEFQEVGKLNLWPQVLKLAFGGPAIKDQGIVDGKYYQKDSDDSNIYVRYTKGRRIAKRNYYYKKNGEYLFYNQGWLYEWFLTYINKSEEHEQFLQQSIQNKTIAPIIYGMDNVSGIVQGDFVDAQGKQVQAKFYNQQIVTFTSILEALKEIKLNLQLLKDSLKDVDKAAEGFTNMFTSNSDSLKHLNETCNQIKEQLLSMLKTKNT